MKREWFPERRFVFYLKPILGSIFDFLGTEYNSFIDNIFMYRSACIVERLNCQQIAVFQKTPLGAARSFEISAFRNFGLQAGYF